VTRSRAWLLAAAALLACSAPRSRGAEPTAAQTAQLMAEPGIELYQACTPSGPERCFDATDDNCNGLIDEGCGVDTGLLQFVIAWEARSADVDLLVMDPNGELVEVGRVAKSGLVKKQDCPGRRNECHGQNLENVFLEEGDPLRGRYVVRVRLEKIGDENPPIVVRFGARVGPKTYSAELELERPEAERQIVLGL